LFVSIPKTDDPLTIEQDRAIELVEAKRKANREKLIKDFGDVQVLNGRWGAYIAKGKENFRIPKGIDATLLTEEEVFEILKGVATDEAKSTVKPAATKKAAARFVAKSAAKSPAKSIKKTVKKSTAKPTTKKVVAKSAAKSPAKSTKKSVAKSATKRATTKKAAAKPATKSAAKSTATKKTKAKK
jgi:DNA topoisomerase-1